MAKETAKPAAAAPVAASAVPNGTPKTGGARPGTDSPLPKEKGKGKGGKNANKVPYPGLIVDGKPTRKLTELPTDFDSKIHKPLKRGNFDGDSLALKWQATILRKKADQLDAQAEKLGKLGNKAQAGKLKRLLAMKERAAQLEKELRDEEDLDLDAVLADLEKELGNDEAK